jgi:hypothetical protein
MPRPSLLTILIPTAVALAGLSTTTTIPVDDDAIRYTKGPVNDPVARLQDRMDRGEVRLRYEYDFGYLRSVLHELGVSTTSQVLVFSKTSFQAPRIAPRTPRALYFNDNVAVGFVRTGDVLEFAALDPRQGIMFYTLDQERTMHPRFARQDVCLQCHQSAATLGVPGLVVRSITPDRAGMPFMDEASYITDHTSPLKQRWGGWYVTGTGGSQTHMGNAIRRIPPDDGARMPITEGIVNVTDLTPFFDIGSYPTPHSDIVALMTLEHQSRMVNLTTRAGWEARTGLTEIGVEQLLDYMLFSGEAKLTEPIKGTSGFTGEFQEAGPRDSRGRSLRDFDLKTRMFRYPCSYMIYSPEFDALPGEVRERLYRRLGDVLTGRDQSARFAHLTAADRTAILEILRETKKGFAAEALRDASASRPAPAQPGSSRSGANSAAR